MKLRANQQKFILWMKKNHPQLYRAALGRLNKSGGLGATTDTDTSDGWGGGFFDSLITGIGDLAPKYLEYRHQKKAMDIQLTRAQQGLPPIPTPPVYNAPPVIVRQQNKLLIPMVLAGVGIAAYFLLKK